MNWLESHKQSEKYASEAQTALRFKQPQQAKALYAKAAEAEEEALRQVDKSKPRTFGVIAISAIALWFNAEEYERSEKLLASVLAKKELPKFAFDKLNNWFKDVQHEYSRGAQ